MVVQQRLQRNEAGSASGGVEINRGWWSEKGRCCDGSQFPMDCGPPGVLVMLCENVQRGSEARSGATRTCPGYFAFD